MPDKTMNYTHPAPFDQVRIGAEILEADPAVNETTTFIVRVTNGHAFIVGAAPPNGNIVNCVANAGGTHAAVNVFGGVVDIGILNPGETREATWLVNNTGVGAVNSPNITIDITLSLWNLGGIFTSTHQFVCP